MISVEVGVIIAVIVVIIIILIYKYGCWSSTSKAEHYSTKSDAVDIYNKTKSMFANGNASYEKYRKSVPNGDIVDYYNIKTLHLNGQLNPNNIEGVLVK